MSTTRITTGMILTRRFFSNTATLYRHKVSDLANRSLSNGSAPSQTPLIGSPEWDAMLKNIEAYNSQPPLSQNEIKENVRLIRLEKRMDQITEILKNLMESNEYRTKENPPEIEHLTKNQ